MRAAARRRGRAGLADPGPVRGPARTAPAGLRQHRSHEVVAGRRLPDRAHPLVNAGSGRWPGERWPRASPVGGACGDPAGAPASAPARLGPASAPSPPSGRPGRPVLRPGGRLPRCAAAACTGRRPDLADRRGRVLAGAPGARPTCSRRPWSRRAAPGSPATSRWTCTAGPGLFAGVLAEAVGPDGAVIGIEADTGRGPRRPAQPAATPRGPGCTRATWPRCSARYGVSGASAGRARPAPGRPGPAGD